MTDREKALMDFRWHKDDGSEVEAFQITPAARWATKSWPSWLQVQRSGAETNRVYTDATQPNSLFISLESGQYEIEHGAYVIHENGVVSVQPADAFEAQFTKVVPVPEKSAEPAALPDFERLHKMEDGKLVKRTPEEVAEFDAQPKPQLRPELALVKTPESNAPKVRSNLRPKAEIALELMIDGDPAAAKKVLKQALSDETDWCNCAPGQCAGGPRWGCREKSPLIK